MTGDEYKEFLKYVFDEYIEPRMHRIERYWEHPKYGHRFSHEMERLKKSVDLINYIKIHCDDNDEIYRTFTLEKLRRTVHGIEDGVRWNNRLSEEAGFLDAFDSHYDEIIEGLDVELFSESEIKLLQDFGLKDPKTKLKGIIYLLKTRSKKKHIFYQKNEMPLSEELNRVVEKIDNAKDCFEETEMKQERPKKSRRWFKGLGQIGQGAALSIGDIALAIGILKFPVSPETQTWGALVSATTGVGMILNGVGELRGE